MFLGGMLAIGSRKMIAETKPILTIVRLINELLRGDTCAVTYRRVVRRIPASSSYKVFHLLQRKVTRKKTIITESSVIAASRSRLPIDDHAIARVVAARLRGRGPEDKSQDRSIVPRQEVVYIEIK